MKRYLSRIVFNPMHPAALRLMGDPYELHRRLLATLKCLEGSKAKVGDQPKTAELLFRVDYMDSGPVLLAQTAERPDWDEFEIPNAALKSVETEPLTLAFKAGEVLPFRLLTRPTKRIGAKDSTDRGKRRSLRSEEEQTAWLVAKAEKGGFRVERCELTSVNWRDSKGGVKAADADSLSAVRFDGRLAVTDVEAFGETIGRGIGSQKAYGFGLLSVPRR